MPQDHEISRPEDLQLKQQLEESDLLLNLYRCLIESADLASGLRSALEIVCQLGGWVAGTAWLPSQDGTRLELSTAWHLDDPKLSEFVTACARQTFPRHVGMPGRVWVKQSPEWSRDLAAESPNLFSMAPLAVHAGVSAALCVPIIHDDQVDGVLIFHAREVKDEDERFVRVVSRVATQLGFALHHKQIEDALRRQETLVRRSNEELEREVKERTASLTAANEMLRTEILMRGQVEARLEQRVDQQAAVAEIGQLALRGSDLLMFMNKAAERMAQTLNVEFCKVLELLPDGTHLRLCAGVGWREGLVGHATVEAGLGSQAGYTLSCNEPVIAEELGSEKRFKLSSLLVEHGVLSGMSVIIPGYERPFGVLGAHTAKRRIFTNEDVHFLESVAHILSEAIERARHQTAIQRSESWLHSLIGATQDAVIFIDGRGCVVLFNASAERIFGYRADEIIGRKVNQLMAEPYASEHEAYIARYEQTGEAHAIGKIRNLTAKRKDETVFPIELSVTEVAVDEEVRYAAFIRDISEKMQLQKKLLESERLGAIGNTAARIAHEIANPLNGIYLTMQLIEQRLARRAAQDEETLSSVSRVKKEIARLNQLVQDFRSLARQQRYDFRPIHLAGLIGDVVDLQQPLLESKGITIERKIPVDAPVVRVDEDKLKQALLNLLKNAVEAMPAGGVVSIVVKRHSEDVVIEISDTGVGIPPGTDVFAPFVTTKKEGTGLGLLIVWQIVTAHGGAISYESQPGKGTTFRLALPLART